MTQLTDLRAKMRKDLKEKFFILEPHLKMELADFDFLMESVEKAIDQTAAIVLQMALKALPGERIIHGYVPSQNTPENKAWNDCRLAVIGSFSALKSSLSDNS